MTTPHHIGQVAKAEITAAGMLEDWGSPHADDRGKALVAAFQDLGWTPPRDLTEAPPLRPDRIATEAERRAAMTTIRAVFADSPSTSTSQHDNQRERLTTSAEAPADRTPEAS